MIRRNARSPDETPVSGLIPSRRFDAAGLPPKQWIDAWHEACNGFYDMNVDKGAPTISRPFFTWHRLDNLMFSSGLSHPHRATRTRRHVRQQRPYVRLLFSRQGSSGMIVDDRAFELGSEMIHLIDYSRPFVHLRQRAIDLDGVYIPHDELGYDPVRYPACMSISMTTPSGYVLASAFSALQKQMPRIPISEAPILAKGFKELVRTLVLADRRGDEGPAGVRPARREAMRAHVERHLREPSVGVSGLARAFSVSRPTVYRAFEPLGGVAHYIMGRRLERAFVDLADRPPGRGVVREVSEHWGFESVSHFSRRFRKRFGVVPSEVVGASAGSGKRARRRGSEARAIDRLVEKNLSAWFASPE